MRTILCFITLFCAATVQAQYRSTSGEFDSGNDTSQSTTTTHEGMFSDWLSHAMQSASYTMQQGDPSMQMPVPAPGAPGLTIALVEGNVRVSWSASAKQFVLESITNLANDASWTTVRTPYLSNGSESYILVPYVAGEPVLSPGVALNCHWFGE